MLAVIAETPGGPIDTVVIRDVPEPGELRAGEIVVRMLVSTFNPSDAVTVSGAYASRTTFPLVPGFEGVGIISRIGPGVPTSALGQRVLPIGLTRRVARIQMHRLFLVHPCSRRHPHRCCMFRLY